MCKQKKKDEIKEVILKYVKDGVLDISKFRKENKSIYSTISYYYGSINNMLDELNLIKVQKIKNKSNVTFRNRLAYDMLCELRKEHTMEQIAKMYGVSRALVNQLHQSLDIAIKKEKYEQ